MCETHADNSILSFGSRPPQRCGPRKHHSRRGTFRIDYCPRWLDGQAHLDGVCTCSHPLDSHAARHDAGQHATHDDSQSDHTARHDAGHHTDYSALDHAAGIHHRNYSTAHAAGHDSAGHDAADISDSHY
jgi:Zn-finger nucleic acid-binding protein